MDPELRRGASRLRPHPAPGRQSRPPPDARAAEHYPLRPRALSDPPETRGIAVHEEVDEVDEELWQEDDDGDHAGWFCVRTDPFPCPAPGCTFVADYMTAAHLVLVWEERDDPNLLWHAQRAMDVGRNPRIVSYESSFGPSASYYAWEAAGRPVHGVRGK